MKIKRDIFRYIERELYDLDQTKESILHLRHDIEEIGATNYDNEIHSTDITSATENKAIKLCTNKALNHMIHVVCAVGRGLKRLNDEDRRLYELRYIKQIHHLKIITCHLPMSERTYFYRRDRIVETIAEEMGLK